MLTAKPKNIFSWNYDVSDKSGHVATVSLRWLGEAGRVALRGRTYEIGRDGWLSGAFYIEERGNRLASAKKSSAFVRSFEVSTSSGRFTLRAKSPFARTFILERKGRIVGSIRPVGLFTRKAMIDLPKEVPLEVQVFLTWLVVVLWKRAAQSN